MRPSTNETLLISERAPGLPLSMSLHNSNVTFGNGDLNRLLDTIEKGGHDLQSLKLPIEGTFGTSHIWAFAGTYAMSLSI